MSEMQNPIDGAKESVEYIIGANTKLKRKRKTEKDAQKEQFVNIMTLLEAANTRSVLMTSELDLNFTKYDEKFYAVIDSLIFFHFGPDVSELIFFYLYERTNIDGTTNDLLDEERNIVPLENVNDLWELIKEVQFKISKMKK
jgi:hypothetical protein